MNQIELFIDYEIEKKKDKNKVDKKINFQQYLILIVSAILISFLLVGYEPSADELAAVNYTPLPTEDWDIATPQEQGLAPNLVAELYYNASQLNTIYGLLIIKNDKLVAEKYFNEGTIDLQSNLQSATKSYISALVGLAFDQGCLTSLDQPFLEFFPEYAGRIKDPRKEQITIRHLLQMRAGYPWEESHPDLWEGLMTGDFLGMMVDYPLISDPGTDFHYSNVSSHYLGVIVERACETDLRSFAEEHLFSPAKMVLGDWYTLEGGTYMGSSGIHITPRDAAKFGLLYLNDGVFDGRQVISSEWVHESLQSYSEAPFDPNHKVGRNFKKIGYGYQWWTNQAGEHQYSLALGHGGQQIVLLDEYDMVIVLLAYPYFLEHNDRAWRDEKANLNLIADFIASLPNETSKSLRGTVAFVESGKDGVQVELETENGIYSITIRAMQVEIDGDLEAIKKGAKIEISGQVIDGMEPTLVVAEKVKVLSIENE